MVILASQVGGCRSESAYQQQERDFQINMQGHSNEGLFQYGDT